jgi:hypothetical protein
MGKAENWQEKLTKGLANKNVTICNPRRDDWDSSWVQKIENPQFNEQVTWELNAQEKSDLIPVYFDPKTQSPITLLEVGLFNKRCVVCCPEPFWRKGNIDIVCKRYGIPQVNSLDELIKYTVNWIDKRK